MAINWDFKAVNEYELSATNHEIGQRSQKKDDITGVA